MSWESSGVVGFNLGPSFKVKRGEPKVKMPITRSLLVLEV